MNKGTRRRKGDERRIHSLTSHFSLLGWSHLFLLFAISFGWVLHHIVNPTIKPFFFIVSFRIVEISVSHLFSGFKLRTEDETGRPGDRIQ